MTTTHATPTESPRAVDVTALVTVVVLGGFMAGLDTALVNVGLTTIAHDLHVGLGPTGWVTSAYLLALGAALPACPWLQRRVGPSRLWMAALIVFTVASMLCAIAPTLTLLITARVLQGVAGGLLVPTGQNIVARAVDPARLGRVMSTAGFAIVLAPAIGPALGGVLVDSVSWRWLFLVNLPIGLAAALLGARVLPREAADPAARLDLRGLVLLATGLPALSLGLTHLAPPDAWEPLGPLLAVVGAALLVGFAATAARGRGVPTRPRLLDLGLFRRAPYAAAQLTVFFTGISQFGGLVVLPLYYETLRGFSVIDTGLLLFAYGLGAMAALWIGGRLTDRIGAGRTCLIGLAVTAAVTLPFVFLRADTDVVTVELLQALRGAGVGMAGMPAMTATMRTAPREQLADATTTANILQRVGGSIGSALVVLVVAGAATPLAGFRLAHALLTGAGLVALVAAVVLTIAEGGPGRPRSIR